MAAMKTAEAGNKLVESNEEANVLEAQQIADEARRYRAAWEIATKFTDRQFKPEWVKLEPYPLTRTIPNDH